MLDCWKFPELLKLSSIPPVQSSDPFLSAEALIIATPTPSYGYADSPALMRQVRGSEKLALFPKLEELNNLVNRAVSQSVQC